MKILLSLLSLSSLLMVGWVLAQLAPGSTLSVPAETAHAHDEMASVETAIQHSLQAATVTAPSSQLPDAHQADIQALSSRDNDDLVIDQVRPGVFKADLTGVHQVVPVATLNADGSVTITEY
ncbi:hypothetical protein [Reinekea blandensis]|uniref:Uncharacterized protein n=1 Tax=Reinekea blandensis MED297 TaxID=314283 RepID=A4B9L4_9GAMM|nr:hypothetical protein [Reinekea blandensis]EAR11315.1 hypothetical protein MED297_20547 [Reinekea sp. MED297] [Reinekea blandensis MED297]